MNFKDIINKQFGDFKVLSRAENAIQPSGQQKVMWKLQCVHCNFIKNAAACNLQQHLAKKCPCQVIKSAENNTSSFWKEYEKSYTYGASIRNLVWELTSEQVYNLANRDCHYCKAEPKLRKSHHRSRCVVKVNGIDRKDSNIGYIIENCVSCCFACNKMKMDTPYQTFIEQVKLIAVNFI